MINLEHLVVLKSKHLKKKTNTMMRVCQSNTDMRANWKNPQWLKLEQCEKHNKVVLHYKKKYQINNHEPYWYTWLNKRINGENRQVFHTKKFK